MPDPLNPTNLMPKPPAPPTPYGTSSVASRVADITSKDSALNQAAHTEAAKISNRRGMLNSSFASGEALDSVLRAAVPIASQEASQAFQGSENALDRTNQQTLQQKDIDFRTGEGALDRALQKQIANWNLSSTDREAASRMVTNLDALYSSDIASINANTSLSATARATQLKAAAALRAKRLNLAEQIYSIDLKF